MYRTILRQYHVNKTSVSYLIIKFRCNCDDINSVTSGSFHHEVINYTMKYGQVAIQKYSIQHKHIEYSDNVSIDDTNKSAMCSIRNVRRGG